MKKFTTIILLITALFAFSTHSFSKNHLVPAIGKFESKLLVVVDAKSYEEASAEIIAYKNILEEQGLGVTLLIGKWSSPDQLKREIIKVYKKKPVMEGLVLIGDIPIVRVRNFQHATTAFKMNEEEFPMVESSVTSDRFYDDLDLEFEFIEVDKENPLQFYYKLKESSPQKIESEFYSARILPPSDMGVNKYELLRRYLRKVVRAHTEVNYADNIKFFNGHGYNFDCFTVWHDQQFAIREQFSEAFNSSRSNSFYNFRQNPFMKFTLFEKLQKPGTDLFVFHEHGAYDTQYINGEYVAPLVLGIDKDGAIGPLEALSTVLRNYYRRYKGEKREAFAKEVTKKYGLLPSFFDEKLLAKTRASDSAFAANINITLPELKNIATQPRITIFDACYNGSFHKPGYIAGYHIFNDGNTIVTQGNTVNVLQDKWSMELIGMIAEGARVGFWQKEIQTLESHLIGDPTYRLSPGSATKNRSFEAMALNKNLALNSKNNRVWLSYLKNDNPNYQAIALKQLAKNPPSDYHDILLKYLKESPYYSVRMEALQRLIYSSPQKLHQALTYALNDQYELIRRNAARFAGYCGEESLIEPLVKIMLFSNESKRVQYAAQASLPMFDINKVKETIERVAKNSNLFNKEQVAQEMVDYFMFQAKRNSNSLATILNKEAKAEDRISAIRGLRNYNNHNQVDQLLTLLKDGGEDVNVRIVLTEALGWFRWSKEREKILKTLYLVYKEKGCPKELKGELHQSILRLKS